MMEELPIKEGMYVEKGQNIFQLFNTDNIWVLLNIFPESQGTRENRRSGKNYS